MFAACTSFRARVYVEFKDREKSIYDATRSLALLALLRLRHLPARIYVGVENREMSIHEYGVCAHR